MAFWYVAAFVGFLFLAKLLAPKPQNAPPPGLGDVKAPTTKEGTAIPILFGTRLVKGVFVGYLGDKRAQPIRKKGGKK